jgi:hypothetical protein
MRQVNHILAVVLVIAFTLTMALPWSAAWAADPAFQVPAGERQLFLDEVGIAHIGNLHRTLHKPNKKGAVIRPTPPYEKIQGVHCAPAWDPQAELWKIWLVNSGDYSGTAYAQSKDGLHWTKPVLSQVEVNGSKENNYITIDPTLSWPANAIMNVVIDPDDPDPSRRFKGLAHASGREPVVSADGINWRKLDVKPLRSADMSSLSYDRKTGTFIAALKTFSRYGRAQAISTSKDFKSWTEPKLAMEADDLDQELGRQRIKARFADPTLDPPEYDIPETYNVDLYGLGVFRYEGLYIGLPMMFHRTARVPKDWPGFDEMELSDEVLKNVRAHGDWTGFHHLQLAVSRDLSNWQRLAERRPFLETSPLGSGAYDLQTLSPPSDAIVRGDELWFYYGGNQGYAFISIGTAHDGGAVHLAVLRRDGFISLDAGEQAGTIQTEPFKLPGTKLFVNVDALNGDLRIELLNGDGKVVAKSKPLTGDLLREPVTWAEGNIADLKGQTASLRFTLRNGQFYSYWLE